jgi:hypothetical protein
MSGNSTSAMIEATMRHWLHLSTKAAGQSDAGQRSAGADEKNEALDLCDPSRHFLSLAPCRDPCARPHAGCEDG